MSVSAWNSCHVTLVFEARTTPHAIEEALPTAVATNCKSLVLRTQFQPDKLTNGAAVVRALTLCPNIQCLRMRLSQGALEYVSLADLPLESLHTLDLQYHNPTVHLVAAILLRSPNLQTLSLGTLGRDMRQTGPAPRLRLPYLASYAQTTAHDVFLAPLHACARTLRALTLIVRGTLHDLRHLRALSRLTLIIMAATPLDKSFESALISCRSVRHLALEYAHGADSRLLVAVAALMPQLVTLSVRVNGNPEQTCGELAADVRRVFVDGVRTPLRTLKVALQRPDEVRLALLFLALHECCRPRRVRLSVDLLD